MSLRAVWDGLGDEIWRQYVDLDSQEHGPLAYDRGLGKGAREPGYLASMAKAHRLVKDSLGERLSTELLEAIHRAALTHSPPAETYRPALSWVGIHRDRIEPGMEDVWRAHEATLETKDDGGLRLRFGPRAPAAFARCIDDAIARFYASPRTIHDVAVLHQNLELWHPTRDGNTRRHMLVLAKLLVEIGENPAIMTEINDVYVRLPGSWARMIGQGMLRWRVVRDAIADGDDVEEKMAAFDREGALGRRGARWLRPNRTRYEDLVHVPFVDE